MSLMKLLVWQPVYVLGGGLEVLRRMVAALGRHPAIDSITLAANRRYPNAALAPLALGRRVRIVRVDVGTPLEAHAAGHDVALVVSRPDQPSGRHLRLAAPPVVEAASADQSSSWL